jgi:hypothetical protein
MAFCGSLLFYENKFIILIGATSGFEVMIYRNVFPHRYPVLTRLGHLPHFSPALWDWNRGPGLELPPPWSSERLQQGRYGNCHAKGRSRMKWIVFSLQGSMPASSFSSLILSSNAAQDYEPSTTHPTLSGGVSPQTPSSRSAQVPPCHAG